MTNFMKTTVFGGVVFLIPVVVVGAAFGKALSFIHALVTPLLESLGVDNMLGATVIHVMPFLALLLLCFLAGLAANTPVMGRMVSSLDQILREKIPSYGLMRAKADSALKPGDTDKLSPVLVRFDDAWQLAFQMDELADGRVAIFQPGSPDPWSGSVSIVDGERVTDVNTTVKSLNQSMKRLGKDTAKILDGL